MGCFRRPPRGSVLTSKDVSRNRRLPLPGFTCKPPVRWPTVFLRCWRRKDTSLCLNIPLLPSALPPKLRRYAFKVLSRLYAKLHRVGNQWGMTPLLAPRWQYQLFNAPTQPSSSKLSEKIFERGCTRRRCFPGVSQIKFEDEGLPVKPLILLVGARGFEPPTPSLPD